jgi:hypothetical protein
MDDIGKYLDMSHLPEMMFAKNRLYISNSASKIILKFDPLNCVHLCKLSL